MKVYEQPNASFAPKTIYYTDPVFAPPVSGGSDDLECSSCGEEKYETKDQCPWCGEWP